VPLLADTPERARQIEAFRRLDRIMAVERTPSARAAATVLEFARQGRRDFAAAAAREG